MSQAIFDIVLKNVRAFRAMWPIPANSAGMSRAIWSILIRSVSNLKRIVDFLVLLLYSSS
eukprot:6979051-Pyramimonas_sp.AAC.1